MSAATASEFSVTLHNGVKLTNPGDIKHPFSELFPFNMNVLDPGNSDPGGLSFSGAYGEIRFTHKERLPRHVHQNLQETKLLAERITVSDGAALVELNGEIMLIMPGTLVDIPAGVPHTWTACPPGVLLPNGTISTGTFKMTFEYEEQTGFFPTASTETLKSVADYVRCDDLRSIMFPELSPEQVMAQASYVWNNEVRKGDLGTFIDPEFTKNLNPRWYRNAGHSYDATIIGFGTVSPNIALDMALKGIPVRVQDLNPEAVKKGLQIVDASLKVLIDHGVIDVKTAADAYDRISVIEDLSPESLKGTNFILEAASENPETKRTILGLLDRNAPSDAVIVTNTSGLNLNDLATFVSEPRRGNFGGYHVAHPAHISTAIEVISADTTSEATLATITDFVTRVQGKLAIPVKNVSAWNRIQAAVITTALDIQDKGDVPAEYIGALLTQALAPRWTAIDLFQSVMRGNPATHRAYITTMLEGGFVPNTAQAQSLVQRYLGADVAAPPVGPLSEAERVAITGYHSALLHTTGSQDAIPSVWHAAAVVANGGAGMGERHGDAQRPRAPGPQGIRQDMRQGRDNATMRPQPV